MLYTIVLISILPILSATAEARHKEHHQKQPTPWSFPFPWSWKNPYANNGAKHHAISNPTFYADNHPAYGTHIKSSTKKVPTPTSTSSVVATTDTTSVTTDTAATSSVSSTTKPLPTPSGLTYSNLTIRARCNTILINGSFKGYYDYYFNKYYNPHDLGQFQVTGNATNALSVSFTMPAPGSAKQVNLVMENAQNFTQFKYLAGVGIYKNFSSTDSLETFEGIAIAGSDPTEPGAGPQFGIENSYDTADPLTVDEANTHRTIESSIWNVDLNTFALSALWVDPRRSNPVVEQRLILTVPFDIVDGPVPYSLSLINATDRPRRYGNCDLRLESLTV